jgi:putative transposase/transposase-like zinc-binding protein
MMFQSLLYDHLDELMATYSSTMTSDIRLAIHTMLTCHTEQNGYSQWHCQHCEHRVQSPMSCGHRNCSRCQHRTTFNWLEKQQRKLLPIDYFMVTFTLPAELRPLAKCFPKQIYQTMFTVSASIIKDFAGRAKSMGETIGFTSVLHTHNRRRDLHPHIHMVVTGGGFDTNKRQWINCKNQYLFNAFALANVWRARLLSHITDTLKLTIPRQLPPKWVVDCRHVGRGKSALLYLSKYLYRGVLADNNILYEDNGNITFRYLDSQTKTYQTRTLPVVRFLWLILQHVLPKGLRRVRDYGLLRGHSKHQLQQIQFAFMIAGQLTLPALEDKPISRKADYFCPCCHHLMRCLGVFRPR